MQGKYTFQVRYTYVAIGELFRKPNKKIITCELPGVITETHFSFHKNLKPIKIESCKKTNAMIG